MRDGVGCIGFFFIAIAAGIVAAVSVWFPNASDNVIWTAWGYAIMGVFLIGIELADKLYRKWKNKS